MICSYWAWIYTVWNGYYGKMLKVRDTVRNGIYGKIPFKKMPIFRNDLRKSRTVSDYIWFWLRYSKERQLRFNTVCVFLVGKTE